MNFDEFIQIQTLHCGPSQSSFYIITYSYIYIAKCILCFVYYMCHILDSNADLLFHHVCVCMCVGVLQAYNCSFHTSHTDLTCTIDIASILSAYN